MASVQGVKYYGYYDPQSYLVANRVIFVEMQLNILWKLLSGPLTLFYLYEMTESDKNCIRQKLYLSCWVLTEESAHYNS